MFCLTSCLWWVSIPVAVVIIFLAVAYVYATWTHTIFQKLGIPGDPPGLMGMLPRYAKTGVVQLDEEFTHKYGRVSGIFHGRAPLMLVTDAEMIKQIFVQDFSNFPNRHRFVPGVNVMKKAVANVENAEWKAMRSIISPTFSSGKMRQMAPLIHACLENMVSNLNNKLDPLKAIKLEDICQSLSMDVIAATAFGLDVDCQKGEQSMFFLHAKRTQNFSFSGTLIVLCMMFPFLTDICDYLNIGYMHKDTIEYFTSLVHMALEERKKESSNRKDFLQLMLNSESTDNPQKGLTEEEILANSLVFIMAGFETTSLTIMFALHNLAVNPEIQQRALEEIQSKLGETKPDYDNVRDLEYVEMILSETLRMYPPATRLTRKANRDTTIQGYQIPKSMIVLVPLYVLHRDPEYWVEPDKFDPERFSAENKHTINPYSYMPFGTGPRNCVGLRLANLVTKLALVTLLQNFRFIQTPETEVTPKLAKGGFVRPANDIWLKVEKR